MPICVPQAASFLTETKTIILITYYFMVSVLIFTTSSHYLITQFFSNFFYRTTAEAIAEEFDIPKDRVISGAMPQDKV